MPDTATIIQRCLDLGFARAGVCAAEPIDRPGALRAWVGAGAHGEMSWLADRVDLIEDPRRMVEGARSIICVADRYGGDPDAPRPGHGRIARYARGRDYHDVIKRRLHTLADALHTAHPDHTFRACVDTAPVAERDHAVRAGLGAVGKHTLLIERGAGSWLLLGEIITTLPLEPSTPAEEDPCGTCTRCIDACPTDAITPWSVDATRCISYLTIEHRDVIDPALHEPMGDWIFGCDVCQEVCPHGQPTERTTTAPTNPAYDERRTSFELLDVIDWTEDDRRTAFTTSAMKRARLTMMRRNALIAAANALRSHDLPALRARIAAIACDEHEDALVRTTAQAVVSR